ncbi:MAG: polysaccharide export protein [Candidatus Eremiobacteraeota bacterium]|nr:polysaccharide export protein [Candidatus Eremiobacteraeota bacterium]MBC5801426.1 polysaccharide export protein [Candidatus Eremiobacteraeota bacterium]MBC5821475.1 polysaccharide export protein [Candidatus Eremiobacteraeota bacterium]
MRCIYSRTVLSVLLSSALCGVVAVPGGATSTEYRIRPGDVLDVTVFGEPTLTQPLLKVLPGGTIVEPLVGSVRVGGLTTAQAGSAVGRALTHYLRHPKVTVAVEQVGPVDVYVLGNVKLPGKYTLQPESRIMDALAAAGGLGPTDGDLPDARVSVDGDVTNVSLEKLLHQGDLSLNERVANDMAVYVVSPNTFNVQVFGAVDKPGDVTMHEGDRLLQAIARAGEGANTNADLNRVVLRRIGPDGKVSSETLNLYSIYGKNGDPSKDVALAKGDTIFVPQGVGRRDTVSPLSGILYTLLHF